MTVEKNASPQFINGGRRGVAYRIKTQELC